MDFKISYSTWHIVGTEELSALFVMLYYFALDFFINISTLSAHICSHTNMKIYNTTMIFTLNAAMAEWERC